MLRAILVSLLSVHAVCAQQHHNHGGQHGGGDGRGAAAGGNGGRASQTYVGLLNQAVAVADPTAHSTMFFALWAQSAASSLLPILTQIAHSPLTILAPSTNAFSDFIEQRGGNYSDPGTMVTGDWQALWTSLYPFLYVPNSFNPVDATSETTVLPTSLQSTLGDWPLCVGFRNDGGQSNGTLINTPYGSGPVSMANLAVGSIAPHATLQVLDYVPTLPQSLSQTMAFLNVSSFATAMGRVPSLAALQNQYNYTLLVPPAADVSNAVNTLSDSALASYFDAHTITQRVVLPANAETMTTVGGGIVRASLDGVSAVTNGRGGSVVGVTDAGRDILLDGGVLQMLSGTLLPVQNFVQRQS